MSCCAAFWEAAELGRSPAAETCQQALQVQSPPESQRKPCSLTQLDVLFEVWMVLQKKKKKNRIPPFRGSHYIYTYLVVSRARLFLCRGIRRLPRCGEQSLQGKTCFTHSKRLSAGQPALSTKLIAALTCCFKAESNACLRACWMKPKHDSKERKAHEHKSPLLTFALVPRKDTDVHFLPKLGMNDRSVASGSREVCPLLDRRQHRQNCVQLPSTLAMQQLSRIGQTCTNFNSCPRPRFVWKLHEHFQFARLGQPGRSKNAIEFVLLPIYARDYL